MFSYISSWFYYIFDKESIEDSDDDYKENYLAEQLVDLEYVVKQEEKSKEQLEAPQIPKDATCFQRTGVITFKEDNYVLIDGTLYFDISICSHNCNVNDQVLYLGYKDCNDSINVVRILENKGLFWGNEDDIEENKFQVIKHVLVGEVDNRVDRLVYIKESDLKFNLDDVEGTFIPIKGDWLELECNTQLDENNPSDISMKQVLTVLSFKPLRVKIINTKINFWNGTYGTCNRLIYFDKNSLLNGYEPQVGSNVLVEAIESNQNSCTWRAIKIKENDFFLNNEKQKESQNIDDTHFQIEKEKNIDVTFPLQFDNLYFNQTSELSLRLTNNSNNMYILNKWIILGKKRDSQVKVEPSLTNSFKFYPGQSFCFTVTCTPKFLGMSTEYLVILFKGFQIKRSIEINVIEEQLTLIKSDGNTNFSHKTVNERIDSLNKSRKSQNSFVPGERPLKPPAFIAVRLGAFTIPEKVWNVVLGDSEQTIYSKDYEKIIERIETNFPCLSQQLNIYNYIDKWHILLYMEEVQTNINMRIYDMAKVFLIRCNEYLCVEINGLSERRPSLIKGDRAIVKDIWVTDAPEYEGYIHAIKGDLVQMKFNTRFHETYSGSDVSIEFHFSRTVFRRSHQAINHAISNLGPNILFPSRISIQESQIARENLNSIKWFNKALNDEQKAAVTNILLAECRPMPYCIFGPPGTGKTITVIETILQILTLLPDSRILVATPSNSASNLIAERLIQYTNEFSGSIVRLIANYMIDSDNIPDIIKPFCSTLDIGKEESTKSRHSVQNGMNLNCNKSFIGRHRVTIGTCFCLGSLAQIGLPQGHFTHVIIDEAGQATEPEIMIPMTFIDKSIGQIVLAGDPMQLGPVVTSKYCKEFGMEESYMSRILECYPYQKDYIAYKNGYDSRLITKLNDNYRSIEEIISLPSEMFYDATLVAKIDKSQSWVSKIICVTNEVLSIDTVNTGGMFVHGVRGINARSEESPSWYNPQEASMVAMTTCKLLRKDLSIDDIGIITPYIAQIKYLRLLFDSMGLAQPKIGTVEEFQGQERRMILISTVRSSESLVQEDQRHTLGFVKNPKRLNVALTRAQVCAILFCNPHLLSMDPLWKRVIAKAIKEDKYTGCDVPGFVDNDK